VRERNSNLVNEVKIKKERKEKKRVNGEREFTYIW